MHVGNYRLDQWLLGAVKGSTALGEYSIAVAWAEMLFYLPGILVLVQRPDLVRATPEDAAWRATKVVRGAMLICAAAVVGLLVLAPFLCITIFGKEFAPSVPMLRILALGAFGISLMELLRNALTAQRRPMLSSAAVSVAFVLTIVLDLTLIPALGGIGASIATTAAYTGGGLAAAVIFTRVFKAKLTDIVPRPDDLFWLIRKGRDALRRGPQLHEVAG
jgi:O-antigen/teichoic acid export membrane protein